MTVCLKRQLNIFLVISNAFRQSIFINASFKAKCFVVTLNSIYSEGKHTQTCVCINI